MSGECEKCGHHCMDCDCKGEAMTDNNSAPELLPCPFCGGEAGWKSGGPGCAWISCKSCLAETGDGAIPRVIAAWNRRAPADLCAADRGVTVKPLDDVDVQGWAAFKCHALPTAIARYIAEQANAALQPTEAQPVAICKGCGQSFPLSQNHDCPGPFNTPPTDNTALVEAAYYWVNNPSAWDTFDQGASDVIEGLVDHLRALASREAPPAVAVNAVADRITTVIAKYDHENPTYQFGCHGDTCECLRCEMGRLRALGGSN